MKSISELNDFEIIILDNYDELLQKLFFGRLKVFNMPINGFFVVFSIFFINGIFDSIGNLMDKNYEGLIPLIILVTLYCIFLYQCLKNIASIEKKGDFLILNPSYSFKKEFIFELNLLKNFVITEKKLSRNYYRIKFEYNKKKYKFFLLLPYHYDNKFIDVLKKIQEYSAN